MDDHSAAGPDWMPVSHLKLLALSRTGETLDYSGLSALHGFVRFMAEEGVSKNATNFDAWAILLACNKPNVKYRPIAIGNVFRYLVFFAMKKLALSGKSDYFSQNQVANGAPAGIEIAIYVVR